MSDVRRSRPPTANPIPRERQVCWNWRSGRVHMTQQQVLRLCDCIPRTVVGVRCASLSPLASTFAHGDSPRLHLGAVGALRPLGRSRAAGRTGPPAGASQRSACAGRARVADRARHAGVPARRGLGGCLAITLPCVLLGFVLARRSLPARLNPGSAGLAALAAYALYMAPVALTGHWTWPGYNFVNDTAPNFLYADLLSTPGDDASGGRRLDHRRDSGGPDQPRLPGRSPRSPRNGPAADGRGAAGYLSPDHRGGCRPWRRWRWLSSLGGRAWRRCPPRWPGPAGRRRAPVPLWAPRVDQGGAGGGADGHCGRPRARRARSRAQRSPCGADRPLRSRSAARLQRGGCRLRAGARDAAARGRARGGARLGGHRTPGRRRGGDRGAGGCREPLGRHELRQARRRTPSPARAAPAPRTSATCCGRFPSIRWRVSGSRATIATRPRRRRDREHDRHRRDCASCSCAGHRAGAAPETAPRGSAAPDPHGGRRPLRWLPSSRRTPAASCSSCCPLLSS